MCVVYGHKLVQTSLKAKTIITGNGLSKLLVRFTQDSDETHHSARINKCCLVVGTFVDKVARGTGGVTLHGPVVTGEKLNQSGNAMQSTDLRDTMRRGNTHTGVELLLMHV